MSQLTKHFSLDELTRSSYAARHGINNMPTDQDVLANLQTLANGLERVRAILNLPIVVTSGYRSPKLNTAIKGSKHSAHMRGLAADFVVPGLSPMQVCEAIRYEDEFIGFRQLIYEFGNWTHISFPGVDEEAKREVLTAVLENGQVKYLKGLVGV